MHLRALYQVLSLMLFSTTASAQHAGLDAAHFQARMKESGAQLVDVRTPEEYAQGHIAGAANNDRLVDGFMERSEKLDKSKPVLLYCAAGGRSADAVAAMKAAGFTDVIDLDNGFNGWKRGDLPVSVK